jgi:hypothetical protein
LSLMTRRLQRWPKAPRATGHALSPPKIALIMPRCPTDLAAYRARTQLGAA